MWVTFEDGFLWWATARDELEINPDGETTERGHFWIPLEAPWSNRSLSGRSLALCGPPGRRCGGRRVQGHTVPAESLGRDPAHHQGRGGQGCGGGENRRAHYSSAVARLVSRLGPRDFELLVDLILSRSGWTRIAQLGGATREIDIEVENAALDELAFVQVKSRADNVVLGDYLSRFSDRRDRYARMSFAVHTTKGALSAPHDLPVQVWDEARISELVVRFGLADWVAKRI